MIGNMPLELVSIRRTEGAGNLKAFVDIKFGPLIITQCAVMDGKRGLFATLPRQLSRDGHWRDIILCTEDDTRQEIWKFIIDEYEKEVSNVSK
jgi:DNA-binding cell septation regulator SpoVG